MFKENNRFEVLTPDGWCDFKGVLLKGNKRVIKTTISDEKSVTATPDHILFSNGKHIKIVDLEVGDFIDTKDGIDVIKKIEEAGDVPVFDLVEVDNLDHSFYVNHCIITKNCDEFAYVPPNKSSQFWTSVTPIISTGGACIITSTPRSDEDQFAQIWKGAIDNTDEYGNLNPDGLGKNSFFAISVPWWEHPERDEAWAKPFRESLGEAKFRQEFCNDFVSDDETLINPLTLTRLKGIPPIYYTGTVRWYKEPEPNKTYMCALDPSLGVKGDAAAVQVFQLPEMIQVAEWQHNGTAPKGQVRVLMQTMIYLDSVLRENPEQHGAPDIYWTVENNSLGEAILQIIEDTGEERFPGNFVSEKKRKGVSRRFRKGFCTTNKTKLSACARLKSLVESGRMTVTSGNLIKELKNFVAKESTFSAKPGEHDDLVSALLLIIRMLDIVINWSVQNAGDMKEYIDDDELLESELYNEPMPIIV